MEQLIDNPSDTYLGYIFFVFVWFWTTFSNKYSRVTSGGLEGPYETLRIKPSGTAYKAIALSVVLYSSGLKVVIFSVLHHNCDLGCSQLSLAVASGRSQRIFYGSRDRIRWLPAGQGALS